MHNRRRRWPAAPPPSAANRCVGFRRRRRGELYYSSLCSWKDTYCASIAVDYAGARSAEWTGHRQAAVLGGVSHRRIDSADAEAAGRRGSGTRGGARPERNVLWALAMGSRSNVPTVAIAGCIALILNSVADGRRGRRWLSSDIKCAHGNRACPNPRGFSVTIHGEL